MTNGGDINNNDKVPGLLASENVLFNNPWTFLPPGTTAQRPAPSSTINYRLRFNTDDQLYEYYDAVLGVWTQLQETAFTVGPFIIYTSDASLPDAQNLGALANGLLKQTITSGVATLDIAVPNVDYLSPVLANGSIWIGNVSNIATPSTSKWPAATIANQILYSDIDNHITGLETENNATLITDETGTPFFSVVLPDVVQNNITQLGNIVDGVWRGSIVEGEFGGTGANNGSSTFQFDANVKFSGAFPFTGTLTGSTAVTFPTSGTLLSTVSFPLPVPLSSGGTNASLTASNGGIFYSTATAWQPGC